MKQEQLENKMKLLELKMQLLQKQNAPWMHKWNITEERINNHSSEEITWNETYIYI